MPEKFDFSKIEDQKEFENLPQDKKDKIIVETQKEAEEENLEKELSPEVVEKIMDKVQDIDNLDSNTFAHVVRGFMIDPEYVIRNKSNGIEEVVNVYFKNLKGLLETGLIGSPAVPPSTGGMRKDFFDFESVKKNYVNLLKQKKVASRIWANPLDRSGEFALLHNYHLDRKELQKMKSFLENKGAYKLGQTKWRSGFHDIENVTILFDASNFQQLKIVGKYENEEKYEDFAIGPKRQTNRTTNVNDISTEIGTQFRPRISNKFFNGIVFDYVDPDLLREMENIIIENRTGSATGKEEWIQKSIKNKEEYARLRGKTPEQIAQEYIKVILGVSKNHPHLQVPLYDTYGNLWWPKKMSYKEVKTFVAERHKEKLKEKVKNDD